MKLAVANEVNGENEALYRVGVFFVLKMVVT